MNAEISGCASIAVGCAIVLLLGRLRGPLLADEGYLWYGVQQLMCGRMPHRDFKSYEPGRYLWSAVFALFIGRGLLTVRIATHAFFAVGLTPALLVFRELGFSWTAVAAGAVALSAWSHPQHKQFECAWWPLAWAAYTHAALYPSHISVAVAGASTGLALLFGFNLFLYSSAAVALSSLAGFLVGQTVTDLPAFAAGFAGGAAPFLLWLLSPGFTRAFYRRRFQAVVSRGSANLPLARPWPWRRTRAAFGGLGATHARAFQWLLAMLVALPVLALLFTLLQFERLGPMAFGVVTACALAIPASHHALSRADPAHVAQSIGPLCLIVLLFAARVGGAVAVVCVAGICLWLVWPLHRGSWRVGGVAGQRQKREVGGLLIDVPPAHAKLIDEAASLCREASRHRADFFAAPIYPDLYAVLERDSPVYDTFCVHPADERMQQEMIAAIERAQVRAALVSNKAVDGRDDLRFSQTHAAVWRHLQTHFAASIPSDLAGEIVVFLRGGAS